MKRMSFQEDFWIGDFGDEYSLRNAGTKILASKIFHLARIIKGTREIDSIVEFGANIGLNLIALHALLPNAELTGVEINSNAAKEMGKLGYINVINSSIFEATIDSMGQHDLSFTRGVLIHQAPEMLPKAYELLYLTSKRYILICEYYNPTPVEIVYRGNSNVMFKRDFAGEMLDKYPDLTLIDYGFEYHRDTVAPSDDISWFLLEKVK